MNILIAYATYSSGTETASGILSHTLTDLKQTVTVTRLSETNLDNFASYDLIILASPSWEDHGRDGQPHVDFLHAIDTYKGIHEHKKFAVMGLGDISFAHFCGAVDHIETWVKNMKGDLVVPSLRIDSFYFDQVANTERVKKWGSDLIQTLQPR